MGNLGIIEIYFHRTFLDINFFRVIFYKKNFKIIFE